MRVHFVAEYDGGVRTSVCAEEMADVPAAYRRAEALLRGRPLAHRIEAWDGGQYVTRATRGVEVVEGAQLALGEVGE